MSPQGASGEHFFNTSLLGLSVRPLLIEFFRELELFERGLEERLKNGMLCSVSTELGIVFGECRVPGIWGTILFEQFWCFEERSSCDYIASTLLVIPIPNWNWQQDHLVTDPIYISPARSYFAPESQQFR